LPLVILGSRAQERDAIVPATGDELIGRDITSIDEVSAGKQILGLEPIMNGVEGVAIHDRRRRGLHVRDQVRTALVASLGEMNLVANPGCRSLLGIIDLWIVGLSRIQPSAGRVEIPHGRSATAPGEWPRRMRRPQALRFELGQ
jgi:hypothetical protein